MNNINGAMLLKEVQLLWDRQIQRFAAVNPDFKIFEKEIPEEEVVHLRVTSRVTSTTTTEHLSKRLVNALIYSLTHKMPDTADTINLSTNNTISAYITGENAWITLDVSYK